MGFKSLFRWRFQSGTNSRNTRTNTNVLCFESLEDRRLLAITWANQGSHNFVANYGADNAVLAEAMVVRAIDEWATYINDFNYDDDDDPNTVNFRNNTFTLYVSSGSLGAGTRGTTGGILVDANQRPVQASITMDDDGGGAGWFFDETPSDDGEFTGIVNAFQASFIDASGGGTSNYNDFYRTIVHEIGHALGIYLVMGQRLYSQTTSAGTDPIDGFSDLRQFNGANITVTLTENGGGHVFEGTSLAPVHPNDLMNPGRTVPAGSNPFETTRQFVSDLNVQLLADAYGYGVTLPSTLNTVHATLDSLSGVLLVQDIPSGTNNITLDIVGDNIEILVGSTTELVSLNQVERIVIAQNGSSGSVTVLDPILERMRQDVDYVVSSNEDEVDNDGNLSNGLVDLDSVVPGNQVTLRAAIQNANNDTSAAIYVPRIPNGYTLTRQGTETNNALYNDLDITGDVTIVGAGAGLTVIDASGLAGDASTGHDRIFHVRTSGATLNLSHVTLTGGNIAATSTDNSNDGGAILAEANTTLSVSEVAFVDNSASVGYSGTATGGAIRVDGIGTISKSLFVGNSAETSGGAVYSQTAGSNVTIYASVFALNSAGNYQNVRNNSTLASLGHNLVEADPLDPTDDTDVFTEPTDVVVTTYTPDYVVTTAVDEFDSNDHMSLREAVDAANTVSGMIWVPAWHFRLTRTGTESDETNDLDILDDMAIRGLGPGLTVLDASLLGLDGNAAAGMALHDRVIEVASNVDFELTGVTLTGGHVRATSAGQASGGGLYSRSGSTLTLDYVAVVDNHVDNASGSTNTLGGGMRIDGAATITRSVFTENSAVTSGGAIYADPSAGTVTIGTSVFANNSAGNFQNVRRGTTVDSSGGNLADADGTGGDKVFDHGTDYGTPAPNGEIVVTTVEDSFDQQDGPHLVSLRDAVFAANAASGADEIWIPAWDLRLTRVGAAGNVNEGLVTGTDTQQRLSTGDIDIRGSLTLRGVAGSTSVDWAVHARDRLLAMTNGVDRVFELEGDYNGSRLVNSGDYLVWANSSPPVSGDELPADGDEDGDVDATDHAIWSAAYLSELTFAGLADPD